MSVRPRRHAHRGSVIAAGFAIDPEAGGARARVLALWSPGCDVRAAGGAWIVRLAAPRRVAVLDAPGAPLVAAHGVLAALPLTAAEVAAIGAPYGGTIVAHGGALVAIGPGDGEPIDPAGWIDVDALAVIAVAPLAAPPPALVAPPPRSTDVRATLGLAPADRGAIALHAALTGQPAPAADGAPAPADEDRPPPWWARWFRRRGAASSSDPAPSPAASLPAPPPPRPDRPPWWARAVDRWLGRGRKALPAGTSAADDDAPPPRSWLDRLRARAALAIWQSALGRTLGRRHADYLRETLDLFDRGDLDAALRRAVPLGAGKPGPVQLALGVPAPRTALTPSMQRPGAGSSIPVASDAMTALRERYLAARDRLLREDRVEEAAFVIADLLGDPTAAVAMLERRGRLRLAAELAEARQLAAGLVIRQWFVAGERARAIELAWRTGAFADALERAGRDPVGDALRLAWADALAGAGDYLAAVDLSARLDDPAGADPRAVDRWIELGIAGGGVAAARLWIRRLVRAAGRFDEVRAAVVPILAGAGDDALAERIAIAQELVAAPHAPATAALARAAARAMLADLGRGVDGEPATLLPRLVRVANDPALRADLPPLGKLPPRTALADRPSHVVHRWAASDAGTLAVHDVALVSGDRVLVALGELGVRLLTADGRTVAAWDQPADALVLADHGTTAIAIARRGRSQRLARLDLARRTAHAWCDAELDAWAPTYDGALWLVTRGRDLLAADVTRDDLRAQWGVAADGHAAWRGLARAGERWGAIHGEPGAAEAWIHERFILRERIAIEHGVDGATDILVATAAVPDGEGWRRAVYQLAEDTGALEPMLVGPRWRRPLTALAGDPPARISGLAASGRFTAVVAHGATGISVDVLYPPRSTVARCLLEGAGRACVRFHGLSLCLGDDRGRAAVVDLRSGALRCDLRLR